MYTQRGTIKQRLKTTKKREYIMWVEFEEIDAIEDSQLRYAVILSRYQDRWVYCKHRQRSTWEVPGGKRELGESILETARRELFEETGALHYKITPVCAYRVATDAKSYGLLCFAHIYSMGRLLSSEIERVQLFDTPPEKLTYPYIQPTLSAKIKNWLAHN